ncbi:glycosyltransferase family 4 protein [Algoriphagus limi]|uniref:Glycosyltransferase family 4 protein n=1 Tax=Algoriphagus limi TaxID=2975273 RepID=A0ABT2G1C5_9BACT|nr:glycosyltransferase family 4 protein [Algoriphagus limi]MCS5488984.1 glycosyltransferase family 4 protein [Algoriphagus limi]
MKILQLVDTLYPGGAERMAVNLANYLKEKEVNNLLVVSRSSGKLADFVKNPDQVKLLHKRSTLDLKAFLKLFRLVNQFQPNVIHAHGTSIYWAVAIRFFKPSLRLIWHDHLGISQEVITNNPRHELKVLSPWIDFIITANANTESYWIQSKIKKSSQIRYIGNFPLLDAVSSTFVEPFTFLHLANFRSEKGQKYLIEAAKVLESRGLDFKVRLVGQAVDPSWKNECMELVSNQGLSNLVSVEDANPDVSKLMGQVHAGLVVSDREGLPVALLEYGLAGLPVISSKVGQCEDVLGNGKYGELIDPGNILQLTNAMEYLINHPMEGKRKGESFQQHVYETYGPKHFFKAYSEILKINFHLNLFEN